MYETDIIVTEVLRIPCSKKVLARVKFGERMIACQFWCQNKKACIMLAELSTQNQTNDGYSQVFCPSPHLNKSMMLHKHLSAEPPKLYSLKQHLPNLKKFFANIFCPSNFTLMYSVIPFNLSAMFNCKTRSFTCETCIIIVISILSY